MPAYLVIRCLMTVTLLSLLIACTSNPSIAWQSKPSEGLTRVRMEGYEDVPHRWGYLDAQKQFAINPQFLVAGDFSEGKAKVRLYGEQKRFPGNSYSNRLHPVGYINKSGDIVIEPQFRYAHAFSNGLAMFSNFDGKSGYIDHSGKAVIPAAYDDAKSFSEGLAFVRPDRQTEYVEIIVTQEEADAHNEAWGAVPGSKMYRMPGKYLERHDRGLWGVIDQSGEYVIKPRFANVIRPFNGGKARVIFEGKHVEIDINGALLPLED